MRFAVAALFLAATLLGATPSLFVAANGREYNNEVFPFDIDQGYTIDEDMSSDNEPEAYQVDDSGSDEPSFEPEELEEDGENEASTDDLDDLEVSSFSCTASLSGGNGFIQIGNWRLGSVDDNHFSFSSNNGRTAVILRSDGTVHPGGGSRTDWGLSHLPITWTYSASNPNALNGLPNVQFGSSWVQFGSNCRIGTPDNFHLSVAFRTPCCGKSGIHTAGIDYLNA
jgi:hypothetical protein